MTDPRTPVRTGARTLGLSVRTRIVATVALMVASALLLAGSAIYLLDSRRIEKAAVHQAEQELAELQELKADGVDPITGEVLTDSESLLRLFMERNVPSNNELLVAWIDQRVRLVSASPHQDLANDLDFQALIRDAVRDPAPGGQSLRTNSPFGALLVTVQPVEDESATNALVVVTFLKDARQELHWQLGAFALISLLTLAGCTALAAWQAGRLLAPLRDLNDTARAISGKDLSVRLTESGNDDITALTRTVNSMLDRLEAAFVGQREFLDDAGHELRTPLTVLRGHLELVDVNAPAEVAETRSLLIEEVDRMSRLVDELILLAKSSRPDFIKPSAIELERLTDGVFAKARAMADREWQLESHGRGSFRADEQRLTQALLQLVDNAVKHTTVGTPIMIGSTRTRSAVELWVSDNGLGIDHGDQTRIFERFERANLPTADGIGLGLSIVRAIAEAHGGTVRAEEAAPYGARFVITIPTGHQGKESAWPAS